MIYLDNAATTFPKPESVYLEMDRINRTMAVNAGRGSYRAAREANVLIDKTKQQLIELLHAYGVADVVFTPSVTHAFNQILGGLALTNDSIVYISPYEHNAVARTLYKLQKEVGFEIEILPLVKNSYEIDLEGISFLMKTKKPDVIILTAISNVTGYVLPFKEIFEIAKEEGAITILDAAQAAGLIDIDMRMVAVDVVAFAGHKSLYGPLGIAGFFLRNSIDIGVVLAGGTGSNSLILEMPESVPAKYEASSSNIVAIGGLSAALSCLPHPGRQPRSR